MFSKHLFSRFAMPSAAALAMAGMLTACTEESGTNPDADKKIVLTFPKGGETFTVGQTVNIKWTADENDIVNVAIRLSPDGGKNWRFHLASSGVPNTSAQWGNYPWIVPDTLTNNNDEKFAIKGNNQLLIKVEDYSAVDETETYTMKAPFAVQ